MNIKKTNLENAFLIEPKIFKDKRGFFYESFNEKQFNNFLKNLLNLFKIIILEVKKMF